jgi:hypothetical protein
MTTSVGLDLDAHTSDQKPAVAALKFVDTCKMIELPTIVHTSKSGKGFHIRTLFKRPITCWLARALFVAMAIASGIDEDKALDKVWPPTRGHGVLALPYQAEYAHKNGGSQAFDVKTMEPLPKGEQLEAVTEAEEVHPEEVEAILEFLGVKTEKSAKILSGFPLNVRGIAVKDGTDKGIQEMITWCYAVERLIEEAAEIPYEFWFGMMTNFKPFYGGREIFQAMSELDTARFDPKALERSWNGINGGPRLCVNLDHNWRCPKLGICKSKSPAALPFERRRKGLC